MQNAPALLEKIQRLLSLSGAPKWANVCGDLIKCYEAAPAETNERIIQMYGGDGGFNGVVIPGQGDGREAANDTLIRLKSLLQIECQKTRLEDLALAA